MLKVSFKCIHKGYMTIQLLKNIYETLPQKE